MKWLGKLLHQKEWFINEKLSFIVCGHSNIKDYE